MFSRAIQKRLASTLAASLVLGVAFASQAHAGDSQYSRGTSATMSSGACSNEKLSVWFERQRQLTDGSTDPFAAAVPAQCDRAKMAERDAAGRTEPKATGKAAQRTQPAFADQSGA
jgi:hypothetical protein